MLPVIDNYEGSSYGLSLDLCQSECGVAQHGGGLQHEWGQHQHLQGEEQEAAQGGGGCSTGSAQVLSIFCELL